MTTPAHTPVLIVGGGMAGLLLALLMRHHGCPHVTLVEGHAFPDDDQPPQTPSFDARSTALSAGTLAVLEQLSLAQAVLAHAAAIDTVHVSRRSRLGMTRIRADEEHLPQLGAVIENRWLGHILLAAVRQDPAIRLRAPDRLTALQRLPEGYRARFSSGQDMTTDLLVAADGAQSQTRQWLGISARQQDTGHLALIANVALASPHHGVAYERFLNDGPLALLPLPGKRCSLVWTGPRDTMTPWLSAADADILAALNDIKPAAAPLLTGIGERQSFALHLSEACAQVVPHAVVVGNAAHTLHPVAGQGFNLTVRDLSQLAHTVGGHPTPGALALLQHFGATRQQDQAMVVNASRWLPEMFRVQQPVFAHSRQLGLVALDILPGLRRRFARRAMGV